MTSLLDIFSSLSCDENVSVLIDGKLCHVKDLRLAWDQSSARSTAVDSSTSDRKLEVNSQMFNAPPAAVKTDGDNNNNEVPSLHGDNNED